MDQNTLLQERQDKYEIEKQDFDNKAAAIHAQGENDNRESEDIGYFKANKEKMILQL